MFESSVLFAICVELPSCLGHLACLGRCLGTPLRAAPAQQGQLCGSDPIGRTATAAPAAAAAARLPPAMSAGRPRPTRLQHAFEELRRKHRLIVEELAPCCSTCERS